MAPPRCVSKPNGHTYTYGNADWKDLLTAYDGQSITYDAMGNPTSYYNGTHWNFTWEHGRRLAAASNGTNNISYTYDADGLRTGKTVDGITYTYYYAGGKLLRLTYGDNVLDFFYDASGNPYVMRQGYASSSNYTDYYYITNLQGDVIRLVDIYGNGAAYYEYDPYGNAIYAGGSHANINPLRYRGYVYDTDTGLYYLQSRYYDPKVGRFINADVYASTGQGILGHNMFAYCANNPVMYSDHSGHLPKGGIEFGPEVMLKEESPNRFDYYVSFEGAKLTCTGTLSLGLSGSIGIGPWVGCIQGFITFDFEGNIALQYSLSGGISADAAPVGVSASIAPYLMITNAPNYKSLEGSGVQVGGSIPPIVCDYNAMLADDDTTVLYHGLSAGPGASIPCVHVMWGETSTLISINLH